MDTGKRLDRLVRAWRAWSPKVNVEVSFADDGGVDIRAGWADRASAGSLDGALMFAEDALRRHVSGERAKAEAAATELRNGYAAVEKILAEGTE